MFGFYEGESGGSQGRSSLGVSWCRGNWVGVGGEVAWGLLLRGNSESPPFGRIALSLMATACWGPCPLPHPSGVQKAGPLGGSSCGLGFCCRAQLGHSSSWDCTLPPKPCPPEPLLLGNPGWAGLGWEGKRQQARSRVRTSELEKGRDWEGAGRPSR